MFAWIIVLLLIYYLGFVNADHIGLMAYPFRVFQNMLPMVMCVFMTIFFYTSAIRITRSHRVEQWKEKLKARLSRIGNGEGKTLTKSQWLNQRKVVLIGGILMCEFFCIGLVSAIQIQTPPILLLINQVGYYPISPKIAFVQVSIE